MELETTQTSTTTKLPMLKQGDYKMWRLRIDHYFQVQDYALWDVIENGKSFKPVAQTTTNDAGTSTTIIPGPLTTEKKVQKKNDVKARSMLLMILPNEHLMTFNQYKDAKSLFAAIEIRFGGNKAIKKTQKTLLKQMYKNFITTSTESLTFIFNRLQKITQDTMSIDDLYKNFKIVEQEVKGTINSNSNSQNMAFVSSPSTNSTNEVYTAYGVSTASTQSSTASTKLALLSMRAKTHKMGHFVRECRGPRNQDNRNRYQDSSRRTVNEDETPPKAMVAIDEVGFD
nr:ribonuclease H-like domain-containing protein [Tanacetum cinerariifolium]